MKKKAGLKYVTLKLIYPTTIKSYACVINFKQTIKGGSGMATRKHGTGKGLPSGYTAIKTECSKKHEIIDNSISPNSHVTVAADKMTAHFRAAVRSSVLSQKKKGVPIAKYDCENRKAYLEYPDGRRQYIE